MIVYLYILDLLGVLSFSFFGSYIALKKKFDLFGIFVCAMLSGLGGGTLREVILGKIPIYFNDYSYLYVTVAGMIFAIFLYRSFRKFQNYFLYIDAIGLSAFAFIGAERAYSFHLSAFAIIFFAVITAVGGGIIRDIVIREKPYLFSKDFYATPAIISGFVYALFRHEMDNAIIITLLISSIFLLRVIAIRFKFKLWSRKT